MKLTGVICHLFSNVIFAVAVFLLAALLGKNIFSFTDIGTEDFFHSGYYTKCVEQKCDDLNEYVKLEQKGEQRSAEEEQKYLRYTGIFRQTDTNFCFWYKQGDVWYTNQPDTQPGQSFDTQTILMEAKTMGDYLLYDMEVKEFSTNIRGMDDYFLEGYRKQAYWPMEDTILVFGIDVQISAEDDLYEAKREYEKLHPWIKVSIAGAVISLMGWILSLVYLTLSTGHRSGEDGIFLNAIDKIKTELLFVIFAAGISELLLMMGHLNSQTWSVAGLLVASGTLSLLTDMLFLLLYLSMVRRMKAEVMWENSLTCWFLQGIRKLFRERTITLRVVLVFAIHLAVCFLLAWGAVRYRSGFCVFLFLLFSALELYVLLRSTVEHDQIYQMVKKITEGQLDVKLSLEELHGEDRKLGEAINNIGAGLQHAVDDSTKNERMKADLITNVSHDIKTPLTSIINYVNLIKLEQIENECVKNYIRILDEKSQRLKQLTEDLVETSRITSGNVKLDMRQIDLIELVYQTAGEFNEKFEDKELTIVTKLPKGKVMILADGRQLYRVIENLYNNVAKYAMKKTRVYVDVQEGEETAVFSIKNVSEESLAAENNSAGDLTERFMRGDSSRTTEGSGLGLSIAKSLTRLMGGDFEISTDGDLFKASITFPLRTLESGSDEKEMEK